MVKTYATVLGAVFVLVGILGFIPPLNPDGNLFGVFHVGTAHNVLHLVSGLAVLGAVLAGGIYPRLATQVIGLVYGVIAVLGFLIGQGVVLGFLEVNVADNALYAVIALSALYAGFVPEGKTARK
ncbi:MAG: DUF4383 domain-containing protein [bacterium]|nr:DUF4383 domain-containing protein [bacterium]